MYDLQRQVLGVAVKVAAGLLSPCKECPGREPTLVLAGRTWGRTALLQHFSKPGRQQLRSKAFWKEVQATLLPALELLAAGATKPDAEYERVREALCLANLPCANPLCTNLSGCSEAHLRGLGQRCSGCRSARYCSRQCQVADYAQHAQVCKVLGLLQEKRGR